MPTSTTIPYTDTPIGITGMVTGWYVKGWTTMVVNDGWVTGTVTDDNIYTLNPKVSFKEKGHPHTDLFK